MRQKMVCSVFGLVMVASNVHAAQSDTRSITLGTSLNYSEGRYGQAETTKIWYVPANIIYRNNDLKLKLTIPYVTVESQGGVVVADGEVEREEDDDEDVAVTKKTKVSGLGDVRAEMRYAKHVLSGKLDVIPYGKVKLDTAEPGLGTGKSDYEAGLALEGMLNPRVFPFVQMGYRVVGDPQGKNYRNVTTYTAGSSFKLSTDHFITAMIAGRESLRPGNAALSSAVVAWNYAFRPGTGMQLYFDKGLTQSSPEFGVGLGLQYRFQ